ncbi:MAG: hypothetical protein GY772_26325 [bacterium]|nr:hypothetical protein [bacterium]
MAIARRKAKKKVTKKKVVRKAAKKKSTKRRVANKPAMMRFADRWSPGRRPFGEVDPGGDMFQILQGLGFDVKKGRNGSGIGVLSFETKKRYFLARLKVEYKEEVDSFGEPFGKVQYRFVIEQDFRGSPGPFSTTPEEAQHALDELLPALDSFAGEIP